MENRRSRIIAAPIAGNSGGTWTSTHGFNLRSRSDNRLSWVIVSAQRSRRRPSSKLSALPTAPIRTDYAEVTVVPEPGAAHRLTLYLDGVRSEERRVGKARRCAGAS